MCSSTVFRFHSCDASYCPSQRDSRTAYRKLTLDTGRTPVVWAIALWRGSDFVGVADLTDGGDGVRQVEVDKCAFGVTVGHLNDDNGVVVNVSVEDAADFVERSVG